MSGYHPDEPLGKTPRWLYIYLSVILKFLTVFIFLYTFTEKDLHKVRIFRENFKQSLTLLGRGGPGREAIVDVRGADPLKVLANRMKAQGITVKLVEEFLSLQQIKDLQVRAGESGQAVILPEAVRYAPAVVAVPEASKPFLKSVARLLADIPYLLEINAHSSAALPAGVADPLELSAQRAVAVYNYFVEQGADPQKLKASGYGSDGAEAVAGRDRIELVFKSPDL
jgi:flagellar motor protein MotB